MYNIEIITMCGDTMIVFDSEFYRDGPDDKEYFYPEDGAYGIRENIGSYTHYITDGRTVWRAAGILFVERPLTQHAVIELLGLWLEMDNPAVIVWENGNAIQGVASDYS
jgi:hypothetical protein